MRHRSAGTATRAAQAVLGAALALALGITTASAAPAARKAADPSASPEAGSPVTSVPAAPAESPALVAARKAAEALSARVAALQTATELAVERYNEVAANLLVAQAKHAAAVRALRAARATQARADRIADNRLRELYMSGRPPGLLDLTIGARPGMDPFHQFDDARFFVGQDRQRFEAAAAAAVASAAAEHAMATTLATQQRLAREAASARTVVAGKLAAEQKLLASASAQVQAILAAEQRTERAAAAELAAMIRVAQDKVGPGVALIDATSQTATVTRFVLRVLAAAEAELGKPYQWGATGPATYDCSGLVQQAFAAAGVALPRTSRQQWYAGTHPDEAEMRPGDLLFWANGTDPSSIHHVAIYLGSSYMIAAPRTGTVVQVQPVYYEGFYGITRVAAPAGG